MSYFYNARAGVDAQYLFALHPIYVNGCVSRHRLAGRGDFNLLDPASNLISVSSALISAGLRDGFQASPWAGMPTIMLGDSGGYQIAQGGLSWHGTQTVLETLHWCEANTAWAMTLDVPPAAIGNAPTVPNGLYVKDFSAALSMTVANLRTYQATVTGKTKFLNVAQCPNLPHARQWLNAIKPFFRSQGGFCDGIAFGGKSKADLRLVIDLLVDLHRCGILQDLEWFHFLGESRLSAGVVLTALQDALRIWLGKPSLRVTFDSSSPGIQAVTHTAYTGWSLTQKDFQMQSLQMPGHHRHLESNLPVPWSSEIGSRITMGDLVANPRPSQASTWDTASSLALINNNLEMLCRALDMANRQAAIMDTDIMPYSIHRARELISQAFQQPDPYAFVQNETVLKL